MTQFDASQYGASSIEVLSGLEPVRKRPGMYTDTSRPNHLAQEVIDNSVDEALAGHATAISVVLHGDLLPTYPGARAVAERGVRTGGDPRNRDYVAGRVTSITSAANEALCFDPQTSGGLLAAVDPAAVPSLSDRWTVVGEVREELLRTSKRLDFRDGVGHLVVANCACGEPRAHRSRRIPSGTWPVE